MSDLLSRIKRGIKNYKILSWPGTETKVRLKLLSEEETLDAIAAADQLFQEKAIRVQFNVNAYDNEKSVQMLYRALMDETGRETVASSITEFRRVLTNEDRVLLIGEYNSLIEECSPSPTNMPPEEFDRLVEALKKNAAETIGSISSFLTLKRLALFLAQNPLPKANGPTS